MPPKGKPEERTILQALSELAGYEDIQTSEDLGKLSESKFMQKWGLPLMTGVEMETEDYDPGAVDAAFAALPFVGGPLKTGFKLVKEGVKKAGKVYRRSVRPRVFPQKDELLRMGEDVGVMEDELQVLRESTQASLFGDLSPAPQPVAQAVRSADDVAQSIVSEFGVSTNVSWNEAQSIVADVGEEGWTRFQSELNSLPIGNRELHLDNFLAKYRVTGPLSGQQAAAAYKSRKFTSKMPDEVMEIDKGRHGKLKYTATTASKGNSHISLTWSHPTNQFISADFSFNIKSKVDDAGNAFDEISGIWFHAHGKGKGYAGRLMIELLEKIPENAVISESSMSYDALYLLLRTAIKKNAKIVFHQTDPKFSWTSRGKQTSTASRESPWSIKFNEAKKLYHKTGDPKHIDKAVDEIMDQMRGWISEYAKKHPGKVVGRPELEAVKEVGKDYLSHATPEQFQQKGYIEYNYISIHKMAGILAGAFGFKNREELMKFISYNPESTEAQVFDNEFSL